MRQRVVIIGGVAAGPKTACRLKRIQPTADITIIDPEQYWKVCPENLLSRGHNTPFRDWEMKGRVSHTLLAGKTVFERG